MITELTASTLIPLGMLTTPGASETAHFVEHQTEVGRRHLQDSHFFGMAGKGAFAELWEVWDESRKENWDGYGAMRVLNSTVLHAHRFLDALPLGTAAPSVAAEADGNLSFEWYKNSNWLLSVSISADEMLYYAAILGSSRRSGTEPFVGEVSEDILNLINRVQSA